MSFALTSLASLAAGPVTMLGLIPILAIGMNYYRYQSVDPEGRPIDADKVSIAFDWGDIICNELVDVY